MMKRKVTKRERKAKGRLTLPSGRLDRFIVAGTEYVGRNPVYKLVPVDFDLPNGEKRASKVAPGVPLVRVNRV